jgi:hypothetical protein
MKRGNFLCTFSGGIDIYRLSETDSLAFSVVSRMSRVTWDTKNLFKKNASVVYATGLVNLVSTVLSYLLRIIRLPISQTSATLTKYTTKLPNIIFVLKVTAISRTSWNIPNEVLHLRISTAYLCLMVCFLVLAGHTNRTWKVLTWPDRLLDRACMWPRWTYSIDCGVR